MVGIVVVNDSSRVEPGKAKRIFGNADDAASSAFVGPLVPLGRSFSPNSSWPRPPWAGLEASIGDKLRKRGRN